VQRFEDLVVYVESDRVLTANGHWQGTVERGGEGDAASCPSLFDYLAEAGAQGWELVAVDPEETGTAQLYFKRTH
jgi:esterase/lipase superfamily enzyme